MATFLAGQIDLQITGLLEEAVRSPAGFSNMAYVWAFASLLSSLFFPTLLLLICLFGLTLSQEPLRQLGAFLRKHLNQVMIESARSWGSILSWSFLLLIPGLVRYLFLTLVPYVTALSGTYQRGDADALKMSTALVKKHYGKILALVFVFHVFIPGVMASLFDEMRVFQETPLATLALSLIDAYVYLMAAQCFLWIFKKSAYLEEMP